MQALTAREQEVAQLVASGYTNQEIGDRLRISLQTVKNHLRSIFRKLAVANRVELALRTASGKPAKLRRPMRPKTARAS
jgi:two-component system response regulator DegU